MDGGAWWATVHRVAKSRTRQQCHCFTISFTFTATWCVGTADLPRWCSGRVCLPTQETQETWYLSTTALPSWLIKLAIIAANLGGLSHLWGSVAESFTCFTPLIFPNSLWAVPLKLCHKPSLPWFRTVLPWTRDIFHNFLIYDQEGPSHGWTLSL